MPLWAATMAAHRGIVYWLLTIVGSCLTTLLWWVTTVGLFMATVVSWLLLWFVEQPDS